MVYGSPPFAHIPGGPLTKMGFIADPNHRVEYPAIAVPRGATGQQGQPTDPASLSVRVMPAAIESMRSCLAYAKDKRLTIPKLLEHEFLQPKLESELSIMRSKAHMLIF
jgi:serine/threonine-protein kinase TTK/MPS1